MKGAISGAYESTFENAKADLIIILKTILSHPRTLPTPTALATYIETDNPSWEGFISAFRGTSSQIRRAGLMRMLSNPNIFSAIRSRYMGILWPDLSIDLVAASLRQREFAKRITSNECIGIDTPFALFKANTRYHKFLLLMNRKAYGSKKTINLVPTLDIDLCWHTHQLFPVSYRRWCTEHLGTVINHDDTIGRGDLNVGLRRTSLAWYDAYREPYTTDDLRQTYFSKSRKIAGVLFPPYGIYMLRKGQKLDHARLGICAIHLVLIAVVGEGPTSNRSSSMGGAYYPYMYMYPYWALYPYGWGLYPAACASGLAGVGGCGAGVGACGKVLFDANSDDTGTCGNCGAGACAGWISLIL